MAATSKSIEIKATAKQCYEVITDFESYPEFLKEVTEASLDKKTGHTYEVTYSLHLIKKFSYTLKMIGKPPKKLTWTFVKGDFMKSNTGEWTLEEKKGVTKATYTIDVNLGLLVPGTVSKMLIGNHLPAMLEAFKDRIEELHS